MSFGLVLLMWWGQTLGGEATQNMAAAGSPHIPHTFLAGLGHSMPRGLAALLLLLILHGGKSQHHDCRTDGGQLFPQRSTGSTWCCRPWSWLLANGPQSTASVCLTPKLNECLIFCWPQLMEPKNSSKQQGSPPSWEGSPVLGLTSIPLCARFSLES